MVLDSRKYRLRAMIMTTTKSKLLKAIKQTSLIKVIQNLKVIIMDYYKL